LGLAVGHWNWLALDEDLLYVGFYVQRIAVRYHDVGGLAYVQGA
jgi:hypothetical protein